MTSSPHGPYIQGCKRATMVRTKRCKTAMWSKSQKTHPSSDCRLQLACMKSESLVIGDQLRSGEYVPDLVHTARQVMGAGSARSRHITVVPTARSVAGTKS